MNDFARTHARRDNLKTSKDAAASVESSSKAQKAKVLAALKEFGPMTSEEVAEEIGFDCWKRVSDLKNDGIVEDTGETRLGSSGRQLTVWGIKSSEGDKVPVQMDLEDLLGGGDE